eukprot:CAMPEP_0170610908 /NCGR_PEP_ID=MMETSP0224-20130122/22910_1 /TAXON_ID=285029 /ORGANISM="Togula jolla, Strain CCCM 725" /LENGTH=224 /DNA_ID=CAMNT_0010936315 /DNA_START=76 /DNA_END=747 /DNA_ORIENTATION=-
MTGMPTAKAKEKRQVRWQNSMVLNEVLRFEQVEDSGRVEPLNEEPPRRKSKESTGCCAFIRTFSSFIAQLMSPEGSREIEGHLWKLNSKTEATPELMAKIGNWRRRQWLIEPMQSPRGVALKYISEKEDGKAHLVCMLKADGMPHATVEELEDVEMDEMKPEDIQHIITDMHDYDLAFDDSALRRTEDDYIAEVPTMLHPFTISAADGFHLTVAATDEGTAQMW